MSLDHRSILQLQQDKWKRKPSQQSHWSTLLLKKWEDLRGLSSVHCVHTIVPTKKALELHVKFLRLTEADLET